MLGKTQRGRRNTPAGARASSAACRPICRSATPDRAFSLVEGQGQRLHRQENALPRYSLRRSLSDRLEHPHPKAGTTAPSSPSLITTPKRERPSHRHLRPLKSGADFRFWCNRSRCIREKRPKALHQGASRQSKGIRCTNSVLLRPGMHQFRDFAPFPPPLRCTWAESRSHGRKRSEGGMRPRGQGRGEGRTHKKGTRRSRSLCFRVGVADAI